MPAALTPREHDKPDTWTDDLAVADADTLIRFVKAGSQIGFDQNVNKFVISPKAFSAMGPGVSVELERLYEKGEETLSERYTAQKAVGALRIQMGSVRKQPVKFDTKLNPGKDLMKVAYTPDQPDGHNPYHCDLYPPPSGKANGDLTKAATSAIDLDQDQASKLRDAYLNG